MITEASFNGGARFTTLSSTADVTIKFGSEKIQSYKNNQASTVNVILPAPDTSYYRANQTGGPHFYVYNDSTSSQQIRVRYSNASGGPNTIATLSAGQCAVIMLLGIDSTGKWIAQVRTEGTPRTFAHPDGAVVANPTSHRTYDPFCFEGTCCEYAAALGNAPLNGEGGRDQVLAPMFQNPCVTALNMGREPIRAADVVMPSWVVVRFFDGEYAIDALHPYGGTDLSAEFYEALNANNRSHGLEYSEVLSVSGRSDHWHHIRLKGGFWNSKTGGLTVSRKVWQKLKTYGPVDAPTRYTMDIRFVMEHTVSPDPEFPGVEDCDDPVGGTNDRDDGAWGAVFHIYVFTNEVLFGSADPISYTPAGGSSSVSFSRDNPAKWGDADGVAGGGNEDKFCHPQMVLCASLPTTFQSPCEQNWVPMVDRKTGKSYGGADIQDAIPHNNREMCYDVGNGAPWCTINNSPNTISEFYGQAYNIVFGWTVTTNEFAAMTTGGDVPRSQPTEFVCFENGLGVGRTVLKPTRPGWEEAEGVLTVADGSSASICICTGDNDCADPEDCDDGSGTRRWPRCEISPCVGHPAEPFEDVGGTHRCFNNNGLSTETPCCIGIVDTVANITEACIKTTTIFDSFCDVDDEFCENNGSYVTQAALFVEDYGYVMNGNQDLRSITWVALLPNPDRPVRDYTYLSTDVTDLHQDLGTWSLGAATITVTGFAGAGAGAARALLRYDITSSWNWYGSIQRAVVNKLRLGTHGVGVGYKTTNGFTGYGGLTRYTATDQVTVYIKKYEDGVASTLTSQIISTTASIADVSFEQHGTDFTFTITPLAGVETEITAQDCEYINGTSAPCLFTEDTSGTNVEFDDAWTIEDTVRSLLEVEGVVGKTLVDVTWDPKVCAGYGECDETDNPTCDGVIVCGCTTWTRSKVATYDTTLNTVVTPTDCPDTDGTNPTILGGGIPTCTCLGPWCNNEPYCGDCPVPFTGINFALPGDCRTEHDIDVEVERASLCNGITYWWSPGVGCS